jgi:outer membrane protein OmpA-like peptidoglycan-associated protein
MQRTLIATTTILVLLGGCATKDFVREEIAGVNKRLDGMQADMGGRMDRDAARMNESNARNDERFRSVDSRLATHDEGIANASKTAKEALDRAIAAGKLAEGKFVYETALTDDQIKFAFGKAALSKGAKAALDALAEKLKSENRNVYLEIQGHTDNKGLEALNLKLGQERAAMVQHYFYTKGVPLHRMNVISYGSSSPTASNKTRKGRAENRRVVIVVLK